MIMDAWARRIGLGRPAADEVIEVAAVAPNIVAAASSEAVVLHRMVPSFRPVAGQRAGSLMRGW
jgi:hypothetical protein